MNSPDDLIVLDDVGEQSAHRNSQSASATTSGMTTRRRTGAASSTIIGGAERTTRSAAQRLKGQPKLKLKLGDKAAAQVAGMSFLGAYDRELDSSDEDLTFEEQFILRMPPGEDCERLRQIVTSREMPNDVWFKFKGAPTLAQ
jgi:transcription initiation factor TFIID subunit 7